MGLNGQIFLLKVQINLCRPPNYLKNKFYGSVRKLVRKLNTFGKSKMRIKNYLKEISVVRPLEFSVEKFEALFGSSAPLIGNLSLM